MFKDLRKIISFILLVVLSISLIRPQSVMAWGKMENLSPLDNNKNVLAEGNVYSSGFSYISFNNIRYWDENTNSIKETKDKFVKSITFNGRKLDELSGDFKRLQGSSRIKINISGMYSNPNMDILISSIDVEEYSDYVDISINTTVSKHINYETSLDIGDTFVGGSTYAFLYSEVHNVCGDVTYVTNKEQTYMGYGSVYDNYPSLGNIYFNNTDYTNISNEEFDYGYKSLGSPYLYFTSDIATYGSEGHTDQIHNYIADDYINGNTSISYTSIPNTNLIYIKFPPGSTWVLTSTKFDATTGKPSYYFTSYQDTKRVCVRFEDGNIGDLVSTDEKNIRYKYDNYNNCYYSDYFYSTSQDIVLSNGNSTIDLANLTVDENGNTSYNILNDLGYTNVNTFNNPSNKNGLNLYFGNEPFESEPTTTVCIIGIENLFYYNSLGEEVPFEERLENINEFNPDSGSYYSYDVSLYYYANIRDDVDAIYYKESDGSIHKFINIDFNSGTLKKDYTLYDSSLNTDVFENRFNPDGLNLIVENSNSMHNEDLNKVCIKFEEGHIDNDLYYWSGDGSIYRNFIWLPDKEYYVGYFWNDSHNVFIGTANSYPQKIFIKADLNYFGNDTYDYTIGDYVYNNYATIQEFSNSYNPDGLNLYLGQKIVPTLGIKFKHRDGSNVLPQGLYLIDNYNDYDIYNEFIDETSTDGFYYLKIPAGNYSICEIDSTLGEININNDENNFLDLNSNKYNISVIDNPNNPDGLNLLFEEPRYGNILCVKFITEQGTSIPYDFEIRSTYDPMYTFEARDFYNTNGYYKLDLDDFYLDTHGAYEVYQGSKIGDIWFDSNNVGEKYLFPSSNCSYIVSEFENPDNTQGLNLLFKEDWGTKVDIKVSDRDGNPLDSVAVKLTDGVNEYIYQNYDSTNKYYYCNEKIPDGTYTIYVDTDIAGTVELNKDSGKKEFTEVQTDKKYIGSEFTNQDNLDGMNLELTQVDNTTEVTIKVLDYKLDSLENAEVKIANDNNEYLYTGYDTTEECYTSTVEIPNGEYSVYINGELACTVELHKANGIKDYDDNTPNKSYTASEYNNNTTDDKALDLCLTQVSTDVAVKIERHDGGVMYCGDSIELSNNNYTFQLNYSSTDELYKSSTGIPNGEYSLNVKGKSAGTLVLEKGNSTKDFTDSITDTRFTSSTFTNSSSPDGANILLTQLTAEVTVIHKDIEGNELSRSVSDVGVGDTEVFSALVSSEYDVIGSSTKSVTVENTDDIVIYFNYKPKGSTDNDSTDNYTEVTIIDKYDGLEHIREAGTLVIDGTINPFEPLPELIDNGYQMKDEPADDLIIHGSEMTLVFDYVGPREIKVIDRYDGSDHVRLIETLLDETAYSYKDLTQIDTTFNSYRVKGDSTITGIVTYEDKEIVFEYEKIDTPNTKPQQPVPTPPSKPDEPKYNIRVYDRFNGIDVLRYVHTYDKGDYYTYSALTSDDIELEGDWVVDGDTSFEGYVTHDMDIVFKYKTLPEETPSKPEETPSEPEETPSKPEETPSDPEETPSKPEETPSDPEETPSDPEETPSDPEETPFKPEETPFKPEETPFKPKETPSEPKTGDTSIPYVLMIFISFAVLAFTNKRKK